MKLVTNMWLLIAPEAQEDGIAPVKDVENDIKFALIKDKKAEVISAEFQRITGSTGKLLMILPVQWGLLFRRLLRSISDPIRFRVQVLSLH